MATPACESDEVGKRLAALRKEAADLLNCLCRRPDGGGEIDASACPVHREPVPVDLLCGWPRVLP
jgi:hypothetical protein